jgi:ATP-binding cassette subfamily B protein
MGSVKLKPFSTDLNLVNKINKVKKYSVLQHDSTDCGSACLASVIRYYGGETTIEKIRKLSGTSQSGTSMLGLYQAAQKCGLDAVGYEASLKDIIDYDGILILHIKNNNGYEHYVVNYGFEDEMFLIWDPAEGLNFVSVDEIEKIWISKKCLSLIPNINFRPENVSRKDKWKWIIENVKPEKDLLLTSLLVGIVISILGMVMALFTQKLIDKILPAGAFSTLWIAVFLVFILLSSRLVITAIRQHLLLSQGKLFNVRIVNDFFVSLMGLPKSFFDTRKTGDFVARLNDTTRVQRVIAEIITTYIIDILVIIITIALFSYYSDIIALISMVCIPLFYFLVNRWNKKIISSQQALMVGYAMNESNFIDSLKGIIEIKSLGWLEYFSLRNNFIYSDFQDKAVNLGKLKIRLGLITGIAGTFYMMIVLIYSSVEVIKSDLTQGELMAILTLSSTILPSIMNLSLISIPINEVKVALNRMFEFSRIEPEGSFEEPQKYDILNINKVRLEKISFRYPGQKLLLEDISLTIEKGRIVSLVGECGTGKSTLASLIMRFYEPESGRILINNSHESKGIDLKKWRGKISIIPQEIHIFNGTLLQNLVPEMTEIKINEAIKKISQNDLDQFINSFPAGLMTMIGEEGINLSGGQKQLIAFLRALLRRPDILIIDEGTANMDQNTEEIIMNLITMQKPVMGILLISHRINLVKKLSDTIYVLENRSISAQGTHNELIEKANLYNRIWRTYN